MHNGGVVVLNLIIYSLHNLANWRVSNQARFDGPRLFASQALLLLGHRGTKAKRVCIYTPCYAYYRSSSTHTHGVQWDCSLSHGTLLNEDLLNFCVWRAQQYLPWFAVPCSWSFWSVHYLCTRWPKMRRWSPAIGRRVTGRETIQDVPPLLRFPLQIACELVAYVSFSTLGSA